MYMYIQYIKYVIIIVSYIFQAEGYNYFILFFSILLSSFTVSAGVGRTGTFIAISTQMKRIKDVQTVDIFNFVQSMRYRRCFMVQTEVGTNTL